VHTIQHGEGVTLKGHDAADSEVIVEALRADRDDRFRLIVNDELRGSVEYGAEGWSAKQMGTEPVPLRVPDVGDLDVAARKAAECFLGQRLR
jgi:hypothetical protein